MRFSAVGLVFLALATAATAGGATDEDVQRQILNEVRELRREVGELRGKVDELGEKIEHLEQRQESPSDPTAATARAFQQHRRRGPDLKALQALELPEDPTREQAREYVRRILEISSRQNVWPSEDPQPRYLAAVGPEHLDVLIEAWYDQSTSEMYFKSAVKRLAGEQHKELILQHLPFLPELAEIVVARGWTEDARETLIQGLENPSGRLPADWIRAVASFQDPETYDDLKHYFVHYPNRETTFGIISRLPGIELEQAVAEAWRWARYEDKWQAREMAPIAVSYGHKDALAYLLESLRTHGRMAGGWFQTRGVWAAILRHIDRRGSPEELQEWFRENRERLAWDEEKRKFVVPEGSQPAR